jgi:broad specificity phosphatase PhoE
MTELLLVRHGETDWNAERRWQGHADVPLNERGREQARRLADSFPEDDVDAIYASDLVRARETAEILGARLGLPVVVDRDLREIDVGSREGLTGEEVGIREWDGEAYEAHRERTLRALARIVAGHPGSRVLVVAHGGTLRRMHEHVGLEPAEIANCTVWTCAHEDGIFRAIE